MVNGGERLSVFKEQFARMVTRGNGAKVHLGVAILHALFKRFEKRFCRLEIPQLGSLSYGHEAILDHCKLAAPVFAVTVRHRLFEGVVEGARFGEQPKMLLPSDLCGRKESKQIRAESSGAGVKVEIK
jgi:hypothetical protein